MLILPLHRPLTRATFPFVTAVLIVLNIAVFGLFQSGDAARLAAAQEWYARSGLATLEWPGYLAYLDAVGDADRHEQARALEEDERAGALFAARLLDVRLDAALRQAPSSRKDSPQAAAVAAEGTLGDEHESRVRLQAEYDHRMAQIPTWRFLQRHSELDPVRLLAHAFLHADALHLLGNMFFLAALGLLVEGALGPGRFALLYLLGAAGAGLFSAAWNWGSAGGGLGASGAIAALMGAFCMLWGMRPVRFFWWFFVLFDYVRKPAIWLLPAWVGWEALNMLFNRGAGVGFDAHLGGLLTGAMAGWILVRTDQVRHEFLDDADVPPDVDRSLAQARERLGRMQLPEADAMLAELDESLPGRLDVALLRHRVAVLGGNANVARQRALLALDILAADVREVDQQLALLEEALPPERPVPPGAWRQQLRQRWMALGCHAQVERLLDRWLVGEASATHWFELALRRRDAGDEAGFHRLLTIVQQRFPRAPEAVKARFLLEQAAGTA